PSNSHEVVLQGQRLKRAPSRAPRAQSPQAEDPLQSHLAYTGALPLLATKEMHSPTRRSPTEMVGPSPYRSPQVPNRRYSLTVLP
ncbi:MAG: hypothetical protein AAFX99_11555, partial [Myxococcota bacterium]